MKQIVKYTIFQKSRFLFGHALGENYVDYEAGLEMTGLQTLFERREKRCLDFSLKFIEQPVNSRMFPLNKNADNVQKVRNR